MSYRQHQAVPTKSKVIGNNVLSLRQRSCMSNTTRCGTPAPPDINKLRKPLIVETIKRQSRPLNVVYVIEVKVACTIHPHSACA